ncbi:FG-GAP repeat protein [Pedobacter panaciterrae]
MKIKIWLSALFFSVLAVVNNANGQQPLFSLLPAKETNISFVNRVIETDSLHVMNYEYLYNGSGVGVADFNGDGLPDIFFGKCRRL